MRFQKKEFFLALAAMGILIFGVSKLSMGTYSRDLFMSGQAPPIPVPDLKYSPKMSTLKVEERVTYEVAVPEEKLQKGEVLPADLELIEVGDKENINFHQVDCFYYRQVTQRQTRTSEALVCTRTRQGTEYWFSNKTRFVDWEPWSEWTAIPKKGIVKKE
ncbi:MAG TPA: hypothetical protein ACFYD3_05015 [Candidatus Hypogeohydataceae bacterium YC41]